MDHVFPVEIWKLTMFCYANMQNSTAATLHFYFFFFLQQVILKMRCEENTKSYFYCKRNLGLCFKANMLQNPLYVFPEKHTAAPCETHASPAPPDRAQHEARPCTLSERSLGSAAPQAQLELQVLPISHVTPPVPLLRHPLRLSLPANPLLGLSVTNFHMADRPQAAHPGLNPLN